MAVFKPPQKKPKWKEARFQPLPVPISSNKLSPLAWNYYEGNLCDWNVVVCKSGDISDLATQGFFGDRVEAGADDAEERSDPEGADDLLRCGAGVLSLTFEESFFLSYGLGCLFLKASGQSVDIDQQWKIFRERCRRFPVAYAAYHHFRSKGWVPKNGLRYGADMVLYRKGPPFYHASYVVIVRSVDASTMKPAPFDGIDNRELTWRNLSAMLRLATTVAKEVMICDVIIPSAITEDELTSPECLKRMRVEETIHSRWASTKQLEKEIDDIDSGF